MLKYFPQRCLPANLSFHECCRQNVFKLLLLQNNVLNLESRWSVMETVIHTNICLFQVFLESYRSSALVCMEMGCMNTFINALLAWLFSLHISLSLKQLHDAIIMRNICWKIKQNLNLFSQPPLIQGKRCILQKCLVCSGGARFYQESLGLHV